MEGEANKRNMCFTRDGKWSEINWGELTVNEKMESRLDNMICVSLVCSD